jgi:hypothetical protein
VPGYVDVGIMRPAAVTEEPVDERPVEDCSREELVRRAEMAERHLETSREALRQAADALTQAVFENEELRAQLSRTGEAITPS